LVRVAAALAAATLLAPACGQGSGAKAPYTVTSEVVSHPTTQEIRVYAPEAKGSWPVVLALHGVGGSGQDMGELGTRLARQGTVVFAPTYRTDLSTEEGFVQAARDDECAYRYARSTAAQHGGDLAQPVTFVGWSLGASFALAGGLTEQIDPTGQYVNCFGEVPRADVIVAISGCYFEYQGNKVTAPAFDTSQWGNKAAEIYLLTGDQDTTCPAWQSDQAAAMLQSAGYRVHLTHLAGATHYAPVFHDLRNGQWVVVADDPAGERTVSVILDAIAARRPQANADADAVSSLSSDPR
jgi:predicted esterase